MQDSSGKIMAFEGLSLSSASNQTNTSTAWELQNIGRRSQELYLEVGLDDVGFALLPHTGPL